MLLLVASHGVSHDCAAANPVSLIVRNTRKIMRIWKITTFVLIILLIGSNAWWLYSAINTGVTNMYKEQMIYERTEMLKQLISVTPELSSAKSKNEIVSIVKKSTDLAPFEKEGFVWVGWTGLKFDNEDKLVKVTPSWGSLK
jgi:hypothetical protein